MPLTQGDLTGSTVGTEHPNVSSSNINAAKSLNRYWTLNNNSIVFTNFAAIFKYMNADVDAGVEPTAYDIQNNNVSSWANPLTTVKNSTNIKATGITAFRDFAAGKIRNKGTAISHTGSPYCTLAGTATVILTGTTQITRRAVVAAKPVKLTKNIMEGLYRLKIIATDGSKTTIPISILK